MWRHPGHLATLRGDEVTSVDCRVREPVHADYSTERQKCCIQAIVTRHSSREKDADGLKDGNGSVMSEAGQKLEPR